MMTWRTQKKERKKESIASGQTLRHTGEVSSNKLWKAALCAKLLENNTQTLTKGCSKITLSCSRKLWARETTLEAVCKACIRMKGHALWACGNEADSHSAIILVADPNSLNGFAAFLPHVYI